MELSDIVGASRTCCICFDGLPDWPIGANNPDPVTAGGACCDSCNRLIVLPAREAVS